MAEKTDICEICGAAEAAEYWRPFYGILCFAESEEKQRILGEIVICEMCKSRVFKMQRADSDSFDGCERVSDFIITVREEVKKWRH